MLNKLIQHSRFGAVTFVLTTCCNTCKIVYPLTLDMLFQCDRERLGEPLGSRKFALTPEVTFHFLTMMTFFSTTWY